MKKKSVILLKERLFKKMVHVRYAPVIHYHPQITKPVNPDFVVKNIKLILMLLVRLAKNTRFFHQMVEAVNRFISVGMVNI